MFENKFDKDIILNRKINIKVIIWNYLAFIFLILLLIFVTFYKIDNILEYEAQVLVTDNIEVVFYAKDDDLNKLKNKTLYVNKKQVTYDIKSYSKDYYIASDGKNYKQVVINCNIDDNLKINNNIINLKFKVGKTTIMKYIIKHFKRS